jgi:glycosyltransferase involved in cell wall biosynthesis
MAGHVPPLHVVVVNYAYDGDLGTPQQALARYFVMTGWSDGLLAAGARTTVIGRFHHDARLDHRGATYHFVGDGHAPWLRHWQVPRRLHHAVAAACAAALARGETAVVHVNGLVFPVATRLLAGGLDARCRLVAQHHAERPWRGVRGLVQRWGLRPVDGYLFATRELARPWAGGGAIRSLDAVHEVMEASSPLAYRARAGARADTGLVGDPIVLWTGNLNANKDPLTILGAFERLLAHLPAARLYMAYRHAGLLPQVEARIDASETLRPAVTLLGKVPHGEIEAYYNSADIFVQGSAREGSGLALLDALACGVVPVVTDIPSFRAITGGGRIGALWPTGDVDALVRAFLGVAQAPLAAQSREARRYFEERWSAAAVGRAAVAAYRHVFRGRVATADLVS